VEVPWKLDPDGMLAVPDGPGLGISINLDSVEKYSGLRLDFANRR
jgi:L-alanine-DL-glutamate epimerase-like enolase superfamily enzyme